MSLPNLPYPAKPVNYDVIRLGVPPNTGYRELYKNTQHLIDWEARKEGITNVDRDNDTVTDQMGEEVVGHIDPIDFEGRPEEQIEDRGVGAPVLVRVDDLPDEMLVRGEAFTEKMTRGPNVPRGDGDVGGDGLGLRGNVVPAGAVPAEEGDDEGKVCAEVGEGPDEVVGAEAGGEGAEDTAEGL